MLTIGALWAVPIALRLVLLENLRHLTEADGERRAARRDADALARLLAFRRLEAAAILG